MQAGLVNSETTFILTSLVRNFLLGLNKNVNFLILESFYVMVNGHLKKIPLMQNYFNKLMTIHY